MSAIAVEPTIKLERTGIAQEYPVLACLPESITVAYDSWDLDKENPNRTREFCLSFNNLVLNPLDETFDGAQINAACKLLETFRKGANELNKSMGFKTLPKGLLTVFDRTSPHTTAREQVHGGFLGLDN